MSNRYAVKYTTPSVLQDITFEKWFDQLAIKVSSEDIVSNIKDKAGDIVAEYNNKDWVISHFTAMPGINLEPGTNYKIKPESNSFINSNGDGWSNDLLKLKHKEFCGTRNFLEHQYDPKSLQGVVLDTVIRYIEKYNTWYIDALIGTSKIKNPQVANDLQNGQYGCSIGLPFMYFMCSQCSAVHTTDMWNRKDFCEHLRNNLRGYFIDDDGTKRRVAMVNGDIKDPNSVQMFEISLVRRPAFKQSVRHFQITDSENEVMDESMKKAYEGNKDIINTQELFDKHYKEACMMTAGKLSSDNVKQSKEDELYDNMEKNINEWLENNNYSAISSFTNYVKLKGKVYDK